LSKSRFKDDRSNLLLIKMSDFKSLLEQVQNLRETETLSFMKGMFDKEEALANRVVREDDALRAIRKLFYKTKDQIANKVFR
jgi:hypothetical protein